MSFERPRPPAMILTYAEGILTCTRCKREDCFQIDGRFDLDEVEPLAQESLGYDEHGNCVMCAREAAAEEASERDLRAYKELKHG